MLTIMRGRRAGAPSSCCPLRVDHHVDHQVSIIITTIIIIMIIIFFMIILVISIFFFRVLSSSSSSGEDVIAWDHVGVQVQEKIGSWCSIYSLCQEQRRTFHTHTHAHHTAPTPIPILHPATGDVSKQSHATSQRFAALRGRHARCKWDRVTSESFSELQVMNAFVPPRPCPRLCSRCSASDDRRWRCSAFVCSGTWTLLSPPPNQTLNGWVKRWFKSMDPTLVPSINDAFVPPHPPHPNPKWLSQVMI